MPSSSSASDSFAILLEQARWEFALPDGATHLLAVDDLGQQHAGDLLRWIASDRQLSQRLLRWSNSPLFQRGSTLGSLREVARVTEARELKHIALLVFASGLFQPDLSFGSYSRSSLWRHSVAVGAVAAMISRTCGVGDPVMMMTAGAMHDIGILASEKLNVESFRDRLRQVDALSTLLEVEREQQAWDHVQLGAAVLEQWGLPREVQAAARWHHEPHQAFLDPHAQVIGCVSVANFLCSRAGHSSLGVDNLLPPLESVFGMLGIDSPALKQLWQRTPAEIRAADQLC